MNKQYLGDSVYVEFDGYTITLTTENGLPNNPSNTIHLDCDLIDRLYEYKKSLTGE